MKGEQRIVRLNNWETIKSMVSVRKEKREKKSLRNQRERKIG
jgi:hypothetical protein